MSIKVEDLDIEKIHKGTPGGDTYYAKIGKRGLAPYCLRPIVNSEGNLLCTNPAGYRTDHPGTGACMKHGGKNTEIAISNITNGRRAIATRNRLKDRIEEYLGQDRAQLLDLTKEFATMKVILDEYMTKFPELGEDGYYRAVMTVQSVVGTLGTLVDKMSKVESRNALTAAQVLYLRATIVDLFVKYIDDLELRERALKELVVRMGGDVEIEMYPSEVDIVDE